MTSKPTYELLSAALKRDKKILLIVAIGFIARLFYVFFLYEYVELHYFGKDTAFANTGDFSAWTDSIKNLIHTGKYTVNLDNEYGYFGRMPGYALFMAPYYLLFGEHYFTYAICFSQIILDTINIYLIYKIFKQLFPTGHSPYIAPFIYALNPINILWSAALYSEGLSVFILILSVYVYTCNTRSSNYFIVGLLAGFNILVRPQLVLFAFLFVIFLCTTVFIQRNKKAFISLILFLFGAFLTYAPWPARNYLLHDKLVLTQDIKGFPKWGIDVNSYLQYSVSIQGDWEPQFSQILHNHPFQIDKKNAYVTPTDSADLAKAVFLSQHYGSSFSNWSGYWKEKVPRNQYDTTISILFDKLQKNQMQYNPFHYWVTLPLQNLKKCLFKLDLTQTHSSVIFKMATVMFVWRTLLILLGLIGSVLLFKNQNFIFKLILFFFVSWYILICWGPSGQMRNIEMRYLLQVDTLMIIPASYFISLIVNHKSILAVLKRGNL
ncbi:MAG: hypothetical protein JWM14_1428 [Chitinophagaceae bacterium]|nr:hypothetical protein [Chitinophagaceae bacterium]